MTTLLPVAAHLTAPADLPALLGRLGYAPATAGGVRLRGYHNPDGSLRWLWPTTLRQPLFLEMYDAASPKAQLYRDFVRLVFFCRLQSVFFRLLPGRFAPTGQQVWPRADFALFTGTPGPNRKAVCCYVLAPGQLVFAKLPLGPVAVEKVQAETTTLRDLNKHDFTDFDLPRVLDSEPGRHLLQSSVKVTGARRATRFGPAHASCLTELLAVSSSRQSLAASNCWGSITEQVAELQELSETRVPFGLRTKLQHLLATLDPNQEIAVGFAHGDFTPWNCWLGPEKLAIYNLELALPEASLLYDLFHFEVQQALLTTRRSVVDIRTQALATAQEHFATVPATELVVAWQLYLLHQVATGALLYHAQTAWHPQVTGLMNGWNALLTLELAPAMEHRQLAIFDLLDYVQLLAQPGVVLKPRTANAYYSAPTSDLNLLLNKDDVMAGVHFLRYYPLAQSAVLRPAAHMQSVDCLFQDGSLLSVDLLHQLERMDLRLLDAEAVLTQAKRAVAGVLVPALLDDFVYTWLFYWLNQSNLPPRHLRRFQQLPITQQAALLAHLTAAYGLTFHSMAEASVYVPAKAEHLSFTLRQVPANGFLDRWARSLRHLLSTAAEFSRPGGSVITFSGVDGAG